MKTTLQEEWEEEIRGDRYEDTGIYHVDGAEYNVDEDKLVAFIKSEKEKSRQEERAELAIKTDVELRRILAEELPKLEKKVRQEVLREVREKILVPIEERVVELKELRATSVLESENVKGRHIEILRVRHDIKQTFDNLLSTLESKE